MIQTLLIANRGEIARRIAATAQAMGIRCVAVFSDADARAPHAREAEVAVRLPGSAPTETYLRGDLLLDAARRAGADAVHPGYGFLSENAEFAAAVEAAGLTWVGPPAKAIAAMGSKVEAKALLAGAGVPILPSWTDPAQVEAFPVLVKASAGGGGRGMRVVRTAAELPDAMAAAGREALAAFGDGTVFCERYLPTARHIEVQIFADCHGTVVALGERECSIQRRHQKIVEESPSPAVSDELRRRLSDAAVAVARTVGYVGAGTAEFLLAGDEFFFLELNTRLQVEHPVTECVTGLDLVRLQLEVADGRPLPFTEPPPTRGHAIEVRLYAEDPAQGWRPATGPLAHFEVPHDTAFAPLRQPGLRLDSGVTTGSLVGIHYDPMLAKLIAYAETRDEAALMLADALRRSRLHGPTTNRDLLVRVLRTPEFLAGATDTAFLDRHPEVFVPLVEDAGPAALAAALAAAAQRRARAPWGALPGGWRNVRTTNQHVTYDTPNGPIEVRYHDGMGHIEDGLVLLEADGVRHGYRVHLDGNTAYVDGPVGSVVLTAVPRFPVARAELPPGSLLAPMPATVGRVHVEVGQRVAGGDLLVTLEAMKLEHPVRAPEPGRVAKLGVHAGSQVEAGAVLLVVVREEGA